MKQLVFYILLIITSGVLITLYQGYDKPDESDFVKDGPYEITTAEGSTIITDFRPHLRTGGDGQTMFVYQIYDSQGDTVIYSTSAIVTKLK